MIYLKKISVHDGFKIELFFCLVDNVQISLLASVAQLNFLATFGYPRVSYHWFQPSTVQIAR